MGRYQSTLADLHTDYIYPSENGLRCDTRMLSVSGLTFKGRFNFSVSEFSDKQLAEANHTKDLVASDKVYVKLDHTHMGVGGDDSWSPSVHPEFLIQDKQFHYEFELSI